MSEYQISLPDTVYDSLLAAAEAQGMSSADWIAARLPVPAESPKPLPDLLAGLVGAINSQEPRPSYDRTAFGEAIAAKLTQQGIHKLKPGNRGEVIS